MLKTTKNEELRYLTVLLYFSAMIGSAPLLFSVFSLLFSVISRVEAHVMLEPRHPGFCLATRLYPKTNTIISYALVCLADDIFARPYQSGEGTCPLVPLK